MSTLKHISMGLIVCLVAILLITFTAVPVLAADVRSGATVTVASGEVIDDDLYMAGGDLIIDGTVNGDIFAAGQTIIINGTINGGITVAAQTIIVNGEIARGARLAAGRTLNVNGNTNRDLVALGTTVSVASTARIGGDLLLGAGIARVDGLIEGDIKGGGGEVTITDEVGGDIELEVNQLTIASTANIQGDLTYTSENEADIEPGAQVGGTTTYEPAGIEEPAKAAPLAGVGGWIISFLMALVTGIIIIFVAPRRSTSIADSIRNKPWPSLGWGAVILFATPTAAIVVCITVIGIPVGLIALALYGIAIYLSQVFVGLFIGRWIIGYFREVESKAILVGALASGLAILSLLRLIPYLGFFIGLATALFALGALVVSERRLRLESQ